MRFDLYFRTYNSFGGHKLLSASAAYLMKGCPDVGDAIRELEIQLWIPAGRRARKTLEKMYEQFKQARRDLPSCRCGKIKRVVEISVASEFSTGVGLRELNMQSFDSSPEAVRIIALDCARAIEFAESRARSRTKDALAQIAEHFQNRIAALPAVMREQQGRMMNDAAETQRHAAASGWDADIEWQDFHPNAKALLDEEFFWDSCDEFAPHGNDSGSDVLAFYQDWRAKYPQTNAKQFIDDMSAAWGIPGDWVGQEDLMNLTVDELMIAIAFAELKVRGECDPSVAAWARDAIGRRRDEALAAKDWPHREDRLKTLEKMERKLAGY